MEIIKIKIKTSLLDARALEQEKSSVKVGGWGGGEICEEKSENIGSRVDSLPQRHDRSLSLVSKSLTIEQDPEPVCI